MFLVPHIASWVLTLQLAIGNALGIVNEHIAEKSAADKDGHHSLAALMRKADVTKHTEAKSINAAALIHASVVVAGLAKDVANKTHVFIPEMLKVAELFQTHRLLIYEDGSRDNTADAIRKKIASLGELAMLVSETLPNLAWRTDRMAAARNRMMEIIEETSMKTPIDYIIFMDLDGGADQLKFFPDAHACGGVNTSVIQEAIRLDSQWDAITFRVKPYWDIWALRSDFAPENVWFTANGGWPLVHQYSAAVDDRLDKLNEESFLAVDSAFMLMEIVKASVAKGVRYQGHSVEGGPQDCEHVAFHRNMASKNGARVRISPMLLCSSEGAWGARQE